MSLYLLTYADARGGQLPFRSVSTCKNLAHDCHSTSI